MNGAAMKTIGQMVAAGSMVFCSAILASTMIAGLATAQSSGTSDDDLKMMALEGLRGADSSVAVPQLEKVLAGNGSDNLKKRALSILAHEDTPAAREAVARFARTQTNPTLQTE